MRHAATKPADDPPPERADLDAKAAQVLDGQAELAARATELLGRCPDPRLIRQLVTETVSWSLHCEEMRAELARYTAANAGGDSFFAMGRAYERSLQDAAAKAAVPGPRHSRRSRLRDVPGQVALFSVKVIAIGAGLGAAALKVLGKHAGHGVTHPAALKLTAYHLKLAAVVTASTATLAIGGAVVITHYGGSPGSGQAGSGAGASSVPGWHTSASPIPSTSLIARTVTHPKPKHGKKQLLSASGLPLLCCAPQPSASASQSTPAASPSPVVSVQVAGTLLVSPQSINLVAAATGTATVRIRAWGADTSWSIQSIPPDLVLTLPDGTQVAPGESYDLSKGQSVALTVGLAVTLDGSTLVAFTVGTTTVSVTVPLPLPVTIPSVLPSVLPSIVPSL